MVFTPGHEFQICEETEMSNEKDSEQRKSLESKIEKLEYELRVSTEALQLSRQQLQLQEKLIDDVEKLRKEVDLANKRLEERDVQLQCLLRQLALTQTKCNELEEERNKNNSNQMTIPQKERNIEGGINVESIDEENRKLKESLRESKEKLLASNSKQKSMRKEIDQLTKELYDFRNERKHGFGCDKTTQTTNDSLKFITTIGKQKLKEDDEKNFDSDLKKEDLPDWGTEKPSLSIADSVKDVAEQMVQELNLEKNQIFYENDSESQILNAASNDTESAADNNNNNNNQDNNSHHPNSSFIFDPSSGMYYDSQSGYYYDTSSTLYYDPRTGTYFYYNHLTHEYEFHSKVDLSEYNKESLASDSAASESCTSVSGEEDEEKESVEAKEENEGSELHDSSELEEGEIKEEKIKSKKKKKNYSPAKRRSKVYCQDHCEDDPFHSVVDPNFSSSDLLFSRSDPSNELDLSNETEYQACMELYSQIAKSKENPNKIFCGPTYHQRQDSSELWPPCIRLIVTESNSLDIGKLFIITCTGASIGQRTKDLIQVNDIGGKIGLLAKISFDKKQKCYTVKGYSKHIAPCVNEKKVFQGDKPLSLSHEDWLMVGETKFSVHIHVGYDTCDGCEPGLVQAKYATEKQKVEHTDCLSNEETKRKKHRKELMGIKKKYGLKDSAYVDNVDALNNPNYMNKADHRRKMVGSDNPYMKKKAEHITVHSEISQENKGRKMLEKLGWSSGESLGKSGRGIVEPIAPSVRMDPSAGLGSSSTTTSVISRKEKNWLNAKLRFDKIVEEEKDNVSGLKPSKRHKMWIQGQTLKPS